ncbi:MAG: hypothetical protein HXS54_17110 [Theionarchaea archaeon]|nr:hypothetical protein [Theionarchaea archaeon]
MKISEILGKAVDIVTENPLIIVPCLIPFVLAIGVEVMNIQTLSVFDQLQEMRWDAMDPQQAMEVWQETFALAAPGAALRFVANIIVWLTGVIAFSMVISMVAASFEGKSMNLVEAFNSISGSLLILIVVSAIVTVLRYVGICTLCIVTFVVWIFFAVVRQGIIIDKLGFSESFSKSWNIGRNNFFDIFMILGLFFFVKIILSLIPLVGDPLGYLVDVFSVAALTILYFDRR